MDKWEYKTMQYETTGLMGGILNANDFNEELNKFGINGWEAISCFDTNQSNGASRFVFVLLKRKIQ